MPRPRKHANSDLDEYQPSPSSVRRPAKHRLKLARGLTARALPSSGSIDSTGSPSGSVHDSESASQPPPLPRRRRKAPRQTLPQARTGPPSPEVLVKPDRRDDASRAPSQMNSGVAAKSVNEGVEALRRCIEEGVLPVVYLGLQLAAADFSLRKAIGLLPVMHRRKITIHQAALKPPEVGETGVFDRKGLIQWYCRRKLGTFLGDIIPVIQAVEADHWGETEDMDQDKLTPLAEILALEATARQPHTPFTVTHGIKFFGHSLPDERNYPVQAVERAREASYEQAYNILRDNGRFCPEAFRMHGDFTVEMVSEALRRERGGQHDLGNDTASGNPFSGTYQAHNLLPPAVPTTGHELQYYAHPGPPQPLLQFPSQPRFAQQSLNMTYGYPPAPTPQQFLQVPPAQPPAYSPQSHYRGSPSPLFPSVHPQVLIPGASGGPAIEEEINPQALAQWGDGYLFSSPHNQYQQ
ncbi:hypothetical protein JCM11641_000967 [Rhodosporidiobolus odoratus]